jgi:hypothetical protein
MRKYILTALLLNLTLFVHAQDKKGFNYTEFGIYPGTNNTFSNISLRTMFGGYLSPKTTLALGIGIDNYIKNNFTVNTLPIFIDSRYFFKDKANSAFAGANIGYAINDSRLNPGVVFGIGAGYRFKISKNNKLSTALRYNVMVPDNSTNYSLQTLGINLGWYL